ncbi:RNA methyltransferase, TrmA family [Thermodesulfatator indicus DSM 15286]|uniref:RNA methyltransferase, TrmA family n=1 Tax=Thermodesulfatator indicus (strain DSM 15286 / JCM 11887 / CIR29812) TaxID=667014 RepID=F8A892_THEID|nr:23S rRNA (uracil(1939)-C(5))-methyltransferase RlmD [Thermodesulfatator indicus]AEH44549.1 RNA methyltransferase, TrmA family [Thermodesulfatator indicus DSM 15286]
MLRLLTMKPEAVVVIEKLIHGGEGLARLPDGQVVFVSDVIPGEKVHIKITQRLGDYSLARPLEILEPDPQRRKPICPYFSSCGGCQFQHLPYTRQLEEKLSIFCETLERTGKLPAKELVSGIVPSPREFFYRNRLQFHVHQETGALGFLKRRSHDLVPVRECALAAPEINEVIKKLPDIPAWKRLHPYVKRVNLALSLAERKVVLLFWSQLAPREEDLAEIYEELSVLKAIYYWIRGRNPVGPFPKDAKDRGRRRMPIPKQIAGTEKDVFFWASPGVFVQANWEINLNIMAYLKEILPLASGQEILDVHCGIGNFLLPLATGTNCGEGVDTDHRAIADAQENASLWGLSQVTFEVYSAIEALINYFKEARSFPLALLDPPRGGCKEILRFLPDVVSEKLVYISCDPPTLARDLKILQKLGFKILSVKAFDMFPQTFHLESVTLLEKTS